MKIICTQENLNKGLSIISHITGKNVNLPILDNVLLEAKNGILKLSTTNLEMGISCIIRGKIEKEGSFTVQAKLLAEYVNLLPKEQIAIELFKDKQLLEITGKWSKTKIKGLVAEDFPIIPQIEKKNGYVVNAEDFSYALQQVLIAVGYNETRPEINGVLLDFKKNKLTIAGTDSYRLAEKSMDLKKEGDNNKTIAPVKTLQEIQRISGLLKDPVTPVEEITVYLGENQLLFVYNNVEVVSRIIEGQYPDYKNIIPASHKTRAVVNTQDFIKTIKTAGLFTQTGMADVDLLFLPKGEITVSAANSQTGETTSKIDAKTEGERNNIVVNYKYLLDGLVNAGSEEAAIELVDSNIPCIIRPLKEGKNREDYVYVVMPIRQ